MMNLMACVAFLELRLGRSESPVFNERLHKKFMLDKGRGPTVDRYTRPIIYYQNTVYAPGEVTTKETY